MKRKTSPSAGVDTILSKPLSWDKLTESISKLLVRDGGKANRNRKRTAEPQNIEFRTAEGGRRAVAFGSTRRHES